MKNKYSDIIIFGDIESQILTNLVNYLTKSFNFSVNAFNINLLSQDAQLNGIKNNIKQSLYLVILITYNKNKLTVGPFAVLSNLFHVVGQNNYLIIREKKVNLISGYEPLLKNKIPEILFDKRDLISLYVKLNRELYNSQKLVKTASKSKFDFIAIRNEYKDLNNFLDEMDKIWENEFDMAADYIERNDWKTEKEFQNKLDAFFIKYWTVFDAMIRGDKVGNALKKICDSQIMEAYSLAFDVWLIVVKSRLESLEAKISNAMEKQKNELTKSDIDKMFKTVYKLMQNAKQNRKSLENKIEIIKEVNDKVSKYFRMIY
ncbi:MAG TPA: hypothetical protein VJY62_13530 [Bacteroidia bacterium]|nr:hypothetical protein [Bacteroidia bacterium]